MPRPVWSGAISFGLVNVPVEVFSAVSQKEVRFHMLHEEDGGRIHYKRVCDKDGEEAPYSEISKGYDVSRGRFDSLTKEEHEAAAPQKTRSIGIEDFVDQADIDPIY